LEENTPQHHPGYKVGQITDGLYGLLETDSLELAQKQGEYNRHGKTDYQFISADD
jgi:hypothetical protein